MLPFFNCHISCRFVYSVSAQLYHLFLKGINFMTRIQKYLFGVVLFFTVVQVACTTTQFKSVWKEDTFHGPLSSMLVVGVAERNDIRRFFEKEFSRLFNGRNARAIASAEIIPAEELNRDTVLAAAREHGLKTILVTHLISLGTKTTYRIPTNEAKFNIYYDWAFAYVNGPSYYAQGSTNVVMATNIYEVKTEELIWSARTKTIDVHQSKYEIIKSKSASVIRRLGKDRLL
jgi:hypothetical protein